MSPLGRTAALILRNDLRLAWRGFRGGRWQSVWTVVIGAIVWLAAHVGAWFFFHYGAVPSLTVEVVAWAFFGFLMLGTAMNQAIGLLFERADFDLLFASPVEARAVLLARLGSITASAVTSSGMFLLPLLHGLIGSGELRYVAGYPVWLALGVTAAAGGVVGALAIVRALGVRRARVVVQVVAAVLGASIYLVSQGSRFLSPGLQADWLEWLGRITSHPLATWPARAGRGDPAALVALVAVAALAAALAVRQMARTFLRGVQDGAAVVPRKRGAIRPHPWREGVRRATFWKDVRLLRRDPLLIAQVLPSLLYLLPALAGAVQLGTAAVLAVVAVVSAGQLSSVLAVVCAAGEEGWDLIRTSPVRETQMRLSKLAAAAVGPLALASILCAVVAGLGRPGLALLALVTAAGVGGASGWLQVTSIRPSPRKDVLRRRGGRSVVRAIVGGALMLTAATGIGIVAHGAWLLGGGIVAVAWLGVIACFTFVGVEEMRFAEPEAPAAS